jgi:hypothetical protein
MPGGPWAQIHTPKENVGWLVVVLTLMKRLGLLDGVARAGQDGRVASECSARQRRVSSRLNLALPVATLVSSLQRASVISTARPRAGSSPGVTHANDP